MSVKLTFEIELRSDYHVSAGHGLGALVDSALHRDADGLPALRGTTITGLLRDGLYRLLQLEPLKEKGHVTCQSSGLPEKDEEGRTNPRFCGQHDPQREDCPVCRVFGSPRTAKHWQIGSARPAGLLLPVSDGWQPGRTGGQIAPHVRISPRTRRAEARKLFFREEGDGRLRFRFTAKCDADNPDTLAEAELLVAAARFVRNLGAARRRGRGECRIHLLDEGTEGDCLPALAEEQSYERLLLAGFRQHWLEEKQPEGKARPIAFTPSDGGDKTPVRLRVVARADEPLLISEKAESGNQFQTVDYIPGSALRGALAGRAAARHNLDKVESDAYRAFVRLFFRDKVQFPTLYPTQSVFSSVLGTVASVIPAVPAPLDLLSCELYPGFAATETAAAHGAAGFALRDDLHPTCSRCNGKSDLKPLGGFLSLRSGPYRLEIDRLSEMHVHIHPGTYRAASGDLFGYDVLASGRYFVGELTCADAASWEDLCTLAGLPKEGGRLTLRLGKACRRGYGKVTLWIEPQPDEVKHPWLQLPLARRVTDPTAPLVLTLLTDAIVPDTWGRLQTGFDDDWLGQELGVKVQVKRAFCASRVVDSFNAHLGLPRWRDVALRAGSAVGLEIIEAIELPELLKRLEKVERDGLGLRCNEGFGRVAFNHPLYDGCEVVEDSEISLPMEMRLATGGLDHDLAAETEFRRVWQSRLLEQDWKPFREPEFESLARLLRGLAPASAEEVGALLARLGRSNELLPSDLVEGELAVREAEKAKLNFFRAGKGRDGIDKVRELARKLAEEAGEGGHCWRIGLEMLADRIAAEAQKEEEGEG
jgi:CRISPR-associated protein Csx10